MWYLDGVHRRDGSAEQYGTPCGKGRQCGEHDSGSAEHDGEIDEHTDHEETRRSRADVPREPDFKIVVGGHNML
jgi:hypothetical protein